MRSMAGKLLGVGTALVLLNLAAGNSGQVGMAQAGCTVIVQPGQLIQQAIDQATENAVICIGQFGEGGSLPSAPQRWPGNLTITKNLTLRGLHPKLTRIVGEQEGQPVIRITSDSEIQVVIEDLTVKEGIQIAGSAQVQLRGLQVSDDTGVVVKDTAMAIITDSRFENTRSCGVAGELIFGWGNQFVSSDPCGTDTRRLSRTLPANPHSRSQVAVPQEVPTIQQAIDLVADGGTITVASGNYDETLEILNSSFSLRGADKNQVHLVPKAPGPVILFLAETRKAVQLQDLTIGSPGLRGPGLVVRGQAVLNLVNSTVKASGRIDQGGLDVRDRVQVTITNSQLTSSGPNLVAGGFAKVEIIESVIEGTRGSFQGAITAAESAEVKLSNSQVTNNAANGIEVSNSARVSLIDSRVTDNTLSNGLEVRDSAQVSLENSTVSGNGRPTPTTTSNQGYGLSVWRAARVILINSQVSSNSLDGLHVEGSATVEIKASVIQDNGESGLAVKDSVTVEVQETQISDNGECGISRSDEAKVQGRNNVVQDNNEDFCGFNPSAGFLRPEPPRPLLDEAEVCPRGCAFAALTPAIRAVRPGGVVRIQSGTYPAGVTLKKGLTLRGAGIEQTILKGKGASKSVIAIKSEDEIDVVLEGVTVGDTKGVGIEILGKAKVALTSIRVSNVRIADSAQVTLTRSQISKGGGLKVEGSAQVKLVYSEVSDNPSAGLEVKDSARVSLEKSTVSGNRGFSPGGFPIVPGIGINIRDTAQVNLQDSLIAKNKSGGLVLRGSATATLTNSEVSNNGLDASAIEGDGINVGDSARAILTSSRVLGNGGDGLRLCSGQFSLVAPSSGCTATAEVKDSVFQDNLFCGIRVFSKTAQIQGAPNEMYGNGADLCGFVPSTLRKPLTPATNRPQLSVPTDFQDLQMAVDAIAPGGTITLAAGSYRIGLTIWKPVTLRGSGRAETKLVAVPQRAQVVSIIAETQGVKLQDLTITGSQGAGPLASLLSSSGNATVLIYGQATLQNVKISKNGVSGVSVLGAASVSVTDSEFSDNEGMGIEIGDTATVSLINSQSFGNKSSGVEICTSTRTLLFDSGGCTAQLHLQNVKLFENSIGLIAAGTAQVHLVNVQVTNNDSHGLSIVGSTQVEIRDSVIADNGTNSLCLQEKDPLLGLKILCNGVRIGQKAQLKLINSSIKANNDWGVAAVLPECGYDNLEIELAQFVGQVVFEGSNTIEGNNKSGKQNDKGNPGNHPWNKRGVPDGQVCLP